MITEKKYDVLRFLEHNGACRIVMDCVSGSPLIYRMRNTEGLTKEVVLEWCSMLTAELEKYYRCKSGRCYRYLNPYSILVTEENKIILLDLNTEDNRSVLKQMQSPAMREHFIKPVVLIKENNGFMYDLYGLGKTIQFLLANSEPYIKLSRIETFLLSGIIEKCLGENPKKRYDNLKQIQKELAKLRYKKIKIGKL